MSQKHVTVVRKESEESKKQRKISRQKIKIDSEEKRRLKDSKEKRQYVQLSNIFQQLGVAHGPYALEEVRTRWEGRRLQDFKALPEEAQKFMEENLPFLTLKDDWGIYKIHFTPADLSEKEADAPKAPPSRTLQALAKLSKQPYSSVVAVYSALVGLSRKQLMKHHKFRLPGIARLSVRYRPALPKRKGINPWTKKEVDMPASPEQNRLRARPDKELREWAEKNIPVVAPPAKHKHRKHKEKKSKRKSSHKKYTRYFDNQKEFHIT